MISFLITGVVGRALVLLSITLVLPQSDSETVWDGEFLLMGIQKVVFLAVDYNGTHRNPQGPINSFLDP